MRLHDIVLPSGSEFKPTDGHHVIVGPLDGQHGVRLAYALHRASGRRDRAFVHVGCENVPEVLLESELFGHIRDGFPGAYREMSGAFERAGDGTLFIRRIDVLSPRLTSRLWAALSTGSAQRVGEIDGNYSVAARVICTSLHADWPPDSTVAALLRSFDRITVDR